MSTCHSICSGATIALTTTEFELLRILSVNGGRVVTTEAVHRQVWGRLGLDETDRLRTVVKKLRAKLGDDAANPTFIFNKQGVGYRIAARAGCRRPQKSLSLQQRERAADQEEPEGCAQHSHSE